MEERRKAHPCKLVAVIGCGLATQQLAQGRSVTVLFHGTDKPAAGPPRMIFFERMTPIEVDTMQKNSGGEFPTKSKA
jgi:hypothetical protein